MKHYLNTELKGKIGKDNSIYYPLYFTFSIQSQTYKYRSHLVRRLLSLDEYSDLQELYKDDGKSTILDKDRKIIEDLAQRSIENGKFIQSTFKFKYNFHCRSLLDIIDEVESSLPITKWNKHSLSSELFAFPEMENLNKNYTAINGFDRLTHYKLKSAAIKYHAIRNEKDDTNALMLVYDWLNVDSTLQHDFYRFIENENDRSDRNAIIQYLEKLLFFLNE